MKQKIFLLMVLIVATISLVLVHQTTMTTVYQQVLSSVHGMLRTKVMDVNSSSRPMVR